jgi:hypothetical protein
MALADLGPFPLRFADDKGSAAQVLCLESFVLCQIHPPGILNTLTFDGAYL